MHIDKINIVNYKCFGEKFSLKFNKGTNILVGNNGVGKSTILEALNLALSGILSGKYLRNELSQYLFNQLAVDKYLKSIEDEAPIPLPSIIIEVFFTGESPDIERLKGNNNLDRLDKPGVKLEIKFDEEYRHEYEALIESKKVSTLPIEYYQIKWRSFDRNSITAKTIPIKSVLIDSTSAKYQNGSDIYISRIIRNDLDDQEKVSLSQAYRQMKESFMNESSVETLNKKLTDKIGSKNLEISVDLSAKNSWENVLMTYLDKIPFHQIGKGDQSIIKTKLALQHEKSTEAQLLLIEEPENHLSHTKLNELMNDIKTNGIDKQVIISTHSNFVANKLGLDNLILLNNNKVAKLSDLKNETYDFFKKLPGYNTLRLVLSQKTILVEGDSDELIFKKAYMKKNNGKLPIENGIDVISCALSFKRFLDIATLINIPVAVITDNDSDYQKNIITKYKGYTGLNNIGIFADDNEELNTLEPQFVNVNDLSTLSNLVRKKKVKNETQKDLVKFMENNKASWALKVFESENSFNYPEYIEKAVKWCHE